VGAEGPELLGERRTRLGGVVGHEAEPVAVLAQPLDRLGAARDRLARDVEDAVDVQQNRRHGRRVYSRDAIGRPPAERGALPHVALERSRRPARTEVGDGRGGALRRRSLGCVDAAAEAPRDRPRRPGPARNRAGRSQSAAESRARPRAARRAAPSRPARGAQARADRADGRRPRASAGAEAAPLPDQATQADARGVTDPAPKAFYPLEPMAPISVTLAPPDPPPPGL